MVSSHLQNSSLALICGFRSLCHKDLPKSVSMVCSSMSTIRFWPHYGMRDNTTVLYMFTVRLRWWLMLFKSCGNVLVSLSNITCFAAWTSDMVSHTTLKCFIDIHHKLLVYVSMCIESVYVMFVSDHKWVSHHIEEITCANFLRLCQSLGHSVNNNNNNNMFFI